MTSDPFLLLDRGVGPVVIAVGAGLFGGFVRGFSGFGFALAAVPILTLAFAPAEAVPAVLPIEVLLGLATVPGQREHVSWPALRWLLVGTLIGTPLGLAVLASAPAPLMRLTVGVVVLFAVAILWQRPELPVLPRPGWMSVSGFVSGCLNGGTAMSGPSAILALLGSPLPAVTARATLMAFIAASAALAASVAAFKGLYGPPILATTLLMVPSGMVGGWVGARVFARMPGHRYRPASLFILLIITLVAVSVSVWTLGGATPAPSRLPAS